MNFIQKKIENEKELDGMGVTDSKLLTLKRRKELFDELKKFKHKVFKIGVEEIDEALKSPSMNLNLLELKYIVKLINHFKPSKVYVDCPSVNEAAFTELLRSKLNFEVEIIAEHKADLKYKVVGGASILAKVVRDNEIEMLKEKYGDCGSGYPSDPKTKEFLSENYLKHKELFRRTWQTYKDKIKEKEQKSLFSFSSKA